MRSTHNTSQSGDEDGSRRRCLAVCGPTASGKSELSDLIAEDADTANMLVDSIQVYREIPEITNQRRSRPADLCGVVSVSDEWSVASHRDAVLDRVSTGGSHFVLDAGTGMYLNAILLDFPLAPKVSASVRAEAEARVREGATGVSENPRRALRELELRSAGATERGSVWEGSLRFETYVIYLKPDRRVLDQLILNRSRQIVANGLGEARELIRISQREGISPSVRDAIGVREMLLYANGDIPEHEAVERIATRTRRLARRQTRWFDKLLTTLGDRVCSVTTDNTSQGVRLTAEEAVVKNTIHDIICAWKG